MRRKNQLAVLATVIKSSAGHQLYLSSTAAAIMAKL
jgi:hypothetical protein